ncbi:MAG: ABC transporter permease [Gammaproteobacteria bacterium]|uniref:ABC transporter permease n=1 Tax=Pseudomaricurvus alcaniphilus TaxID=1166482 RepID=UPI001407BCFC|nr:FtsX-like permease family protein [Pseudomaricurvus alcaniphilus]MBR9912412.1 ABC transporter permease [Gammaproteobacteria bacterium]NHN36755.1 ABC transporter permease [Pseudomaricurvus alcaniphilus]
MMLLALRNLSRHRKRTAIALATIGFGVVASILVGGFIDWIFWGMRDNTIHSRLGHIQVTRPGYLETGSANPYAFLLSDSQLAEIELESTPGIKVVSPRLAFSGMISNGDITIGFIGDGVDPGKDAPLSRGLVAMSGRGLEPGDTDSIYLGGGVARNLGVGVGDRVVLLANTSTGGLNGVEATVVGLFQTASKEFDDAALRLPLETARQLLRAEGAHKWVILLDDTELTTPVIEDLRQRYPQQQFDLEFTPWLDLAELYTQTVKLYSSQMDVVRFVISVIIALSIYNILVMGVLERTGEIGTLMALGNKRQGVLSLFVWEGLALGVLGGLLGSLVGSGIGAWLSYVGIPMPPPPGMEIGYVGEILLSWQLVAGSLLVAVLTTFIASLYPAWKASRMNIVDALRHNR